MIWNGHELVSTGHPEDDDPWCKNCGLPADADEAKEPCKNQPKDSS
jgi:hypothetical protein